MISAYLDAIERALHFDRPLSRSVRQEVEDHLRETVAAHSPDGGTEAERRAIEKFGDPRAIAAQFAAVSLSKQTSKMGAAILLVIAAVFTTMKTRTVWYAAMQWGTRDDLKALSGVVGLIDRYSFWLSVFIGTAGWFYVGSRHIPPVLDLTYQKHLRRCFVVCCAATAFVVVSIISDGALTALRLLGAEFNAETLVPILSMAVEIACAGFLVFQIRSIQQRLASTTSLLKT